MQHALTTLPFAKLKDGGKLNARKTPSSPDDDDLLYRSIADYGLILPMIVTEAGEVVAGGRRRRAIARLLKEKVAIPRFDPAAVTCIVVPEDIDPITISQIENARRASMHPVDLFEVYAFQVGAGSTIEDVARREGLKVSQVRQALALSRLAPEIRERWRKGEISAEAAEEFAVTPDHDAQRAVLKKVGKRVDAWQIKQTMRGGHDEPSSGAMMAVVTRAAYEKAGHRINETLFAGEDRDTLAVSDLPALRGMFLQALSERCDALTKAGWKWAYYDREAPKDWRSWRRVDAPPGGKFAKDKMAEMGIVLSVDWNGRVTEVRGIVKPGDKVVMPKTAKEKKAAAKKVAERKEETGGISGALAQRLSDQLTKAVRVAMVEGIAEKDAVPIAIAFLACACDGSTLRLGRVDYNDDLGRHDNKFEKYLALALSKAPKERARLLMQWVGEAVDLKAYRGDVLDRWLHPDKKDKDADRAIATLAEAIDPKAFEIAARQAFDAADYFASVSRAMTFEALEEMKAAGGLKDAKKAELVEFATKAAKNAGWVPPAMRRAR